MTFRAILMSTALILATGQSAMAQQSVPSCDQLRSSPVHQSRPDIVRQVYPDAVYVGQGRDAAALVRSGQVACAAAALDHNGNIVYRGR